MAKKKKSQAAMPPDGDCRTDDIDTRPESSPYAASKYTIRTKGGTDFVFPSPLLHKCPRLQSLFDLWNSSIHLEISSDVGHVLVHYLFTDTYQSLKPKGTSDERLATEFTTSMQVYSLARKYEIGLLEELARCEMERFGNELSFNKTLDMLRSAYPDPSANDAWLGNYLKSRLQSVFQNPSETSAFLDFLKSGTESNLFSVSDLLFTSLVELVHTGAISPPDPDAALQLEPLEDSALVIQGVDPMEPASDGTKPERKQDDPLTTRPICNGYDGDNRDLVSALEPEAEPTPEPEPIPEPEEILEQEAETIVYPEPEPTPEPEPEPISDPTSVLEAETEPYRVSEPLPDILAEPATDPVFRPAHEMGLEFTDEPVAATPAQKKKKKKKKGKAETLSEDATHPPELPENGEPAEQVAHQHQADRPSTLGFWSIDGSNIKDTNLGPGCPRRSEHIFGRGWETCSECRNFIRRLSGQVSYD